MSDKKFATAINCMDGRTQIPVAEWMKKMFKVDYVDAVTEPGPIKLIAEFKDIQVIANIKKRVDISVNHHRSKAIAVVGHFDCAGNPVDKNTQVLQIADAVKKIKTWGFDVTVVGLWVDEDWKVSQIA
jgi:hypothetical protein